MNTTQIFNMKYLITESQLDKAYSKYLDHIFDGVHMDPLKSYFRYKVYSTDEMRAFTYSVLSKDVMFLKCLLRSLKICLLTWIRRKHWRSLVNGLNINLVTPLEM